MRAIIFALLFLISFAAQAAFFCAKAQSSRFDDSAVQARIEALIKAQISLEQRDFGSQSEFEMALAYFRNETAKLHQAVPGFVARYKQRFLELKDQVLDHQTAARRKKETAEKNRREVVRRAQALDPIEVHEILHGSSVLSTRFSPDGKLIVTGSWDSKIRIIDAITGQTLREVSHDNSVYSVSFSPDGKLLVAGSGKKVTIIDVATGQVLRQIPHENAVSSVNFSSDGKFIVARSGISVLTINVITGQIILKIVQGELFNDTSFSADGKLGVRVAHDGKATIIDAATGKVLLKELDHEGWRVNTTSFSPDGKFLATGSEGGKVRIFQLYLEIEE